MTEKATYPAEDGSAPKVYLPTPEKAAYDTTERIRVAVRNDVHHLVQPHHRTRSMSSDQLPDSAATEFCLHPRGYGKNTAAEQALRNSIAAGEHSHRLSTDGTECWNGHDGCPTWRKQGGRDPVLVAT